MFAMFRKRYMLLFVLGAILLALFTACGTDPAAATQMQATEANQPYYIQAVSLPEPIQAVTAISRISDSSALLLSQLEDGTAVYRLDMENGQCLAQYYLDGGNRITMLAGIPNQFEFWCGVETGSGELFLRHVNQQGEVTAEISLFEDTEHTGLYGMQAQSDGNVYLYWKTTVEKSDTDAGLLCYGADGSQQFALSNVSTEGALVQKDDGTVLYLQDGTLYRVGEAELDSQFTLAADCATPLYGTEQTLLGTDGKATVSYGDGECASLFLFSDLGITQEPDVGGMFPMENDGYLAVINGTLYQILPGTAPSGSDSRQVITIGTLYSSAVLTEAVSLFNESNDTYQAQILDYGLYVSDDGDLSTAQNLIHTELVTGGGPDVIAFGLMGSSDQTGISAEQLSALGLLEDLYPYLNTDSELSTDSFYAGLMTLLDDGGSLYQLPSGFYIRTAVGSESVVGNRNGWRFSDMLECAAAMPDLQYTFGSTISRSRLTELMLSFNCNQFVDYSTGECHFDSQEFIDLLNFLNTCYTGDTDQREIPAYAVAAGRQMLGVVTVGTVTEMQEYTAIFGEPVYIGMPTTEGTGTAFSLTNAVGICSNSLHKDGAWEFLKTLCTQSTCDGFPANQELLDSYFSAPENRDPWDLIVGYEDDEKNTWEFAFTKPTSDDVQQTKHLIALADRIYQPDANISAIVQEEAEAFYAGDKTAEETADLIQNRVKIYINEQKSSY